MAYKEFQINNGTPYDILDSIQGAHIKKIGFSVLLFLSVFILVEGSLRLAGFGIQFLQDSANEIRPEDSKLTRILTIGESTTADWQEGSHRYESWPRQLEKNLNQEGQRFRVYNVARIGTDTAHLLARLPQQLDQYRPAIVIAMMGINDQEGLTFRPARAGIFSGSRVFRLFQWMYERWGFSSQAKPVENRDFSTPQDATLLARLKKEPVYQVLPAIERRMQTMSSIERAQYLDFLGRKSEPILGADIKTYETSALLFEKSLAEHFEVECAAGNYLFLSSWMGKPQRCLEVAKQYVERFGSFAGTCTRAQLGAVRCALASDRNPEWLKAFRGDPEVEVSWSERPNEVVRENYRALQRLLDQRGIRLVAMQYPLLDVQQLEALLPRERGVEFVENRANFEAALKKVDASLLFTDRFSKRFGHTTSYGHRLIAEAAAIGVKKSLCGGDGQNRTDTIRFCKPSH